MECHWKRGYLAGNSKNLEGAFYFPRIPETHIWARCAKQVTAVSTISGYTFFEILVFIQIHDPTVVFHSSTLVFRHSIPVFHSSQKVEIFDG